MNHLILLLALSTTIITQAQSLPTNASKEHKKTPESKLKSETIFPSKILDDDFDGTPCEIVFDENQIRDISKFTKESRNGLGSPSSPLKTLAKVYFSKTNNTITSTLECNRTSAELKNFPPLENDYLKCLSIAIGSWKINNLTYNDFVKLNHPNSELTRTKHLVFKSPADYENEKKKIQHIKLPPGRIAVLLAFRIDTPKQKYLVIINKFTINGEAGYSSSVLIYHENHWKFLSNNANVEEITPETFAHGLSPLFEEKTTQAKITPLN